MAANDTTPLIEKRSIDYIPEAERHGRLLSQFTLWMGANLQITAIVTGALAVVLGGDVFWSLIGLLVGQLIGGGVMALHAAQGPKLGLPQMISSRVQFGVYGAAIPIVLVCLMYLGFTATGTVLSGQALGQLFGVSDSVGILIFASVIVLVTVLGYRVIHFIGRVASVIGVIAFVYLFSRLIGQTDVGALPVARRTADTAVHHQFFRVLGHLRVEVVHQHAQRRFSQPAFGGELVTVGGTDFDVAVFCRLGFRKIGHCWTPRHDARTWMVRRRVLRTHLYLYIQAYAIKRPTLERRHRDFL